MAEASEAASSDDVAERIQYLKGITHLFGEWDEVSLRDLARCMTTRSVKADTVIIEQGQASPAIFFIRSGSCEVVKLLPPEADAEQQQQPKPPPKKSKRRGSITEDLVSRAALQRTSFATEHQAVTLKVMSPPEYFGELGVLLESGSTAYVISTSDVDLYQLAKEDWKARITEQTRSQMVAAMISHAESNYTYAASFARSLTIGLRDEFQFEDEPPSAEPPATAAAAASKPPPKLDAQQVLRLHLLPLFAPSMVQATAMGLLVPVLPLRASELYPQDSAIGGVVSGRGAGSMAGGPLAGFVIAALGLRSGLMSGLGLAALAAFGGAIVPDVWLLLLTRLLAGVGLAFFTVGRQTYVAQNIPPSSRGTVSAFVAGTTRLGTTIGPIAGGLSAQFLGNSFAFCRKLWMVLIASLVLGLGNGMSNGWIQTVGADLAPEGFRPQFLGMWNLLMGLGSAVGPSAMGAVAQLASLDVASLVAAAVSLAGAAWYVFYAEETLKQEKQEAAAPTSRPVSPALAPSQPKKKELW